MIKKVSFGLMELVINLLIYALVIFVIIKAATFAYGFSYEVFGSKAADSQDTNAQTLVISEGMTADDIGDILEDMGIAKHSMAFSIKMRLDKATDKIVPGTYQVSRAMPLDYIVDLLVSGPEKEDSGTSLYLVKQEVNTGSEIEDDTNMEESSTDAGGEGSAE